MNKIVALVLFSICNAYGMEESRLNNGTQRFIDLCANNVKDLHPNELSKMMLVTALMKIVPNKASILRQEPLSQRREKFSAEVAFALEQHAPGTTFKRNFDACDQATSLLRLGQIHELTQQQ